MSAPRSGKQLRRPKTRIPAQVSLHPYLCVHDDIRVLYRADSVHRVCRYLRLRTVDPAYVRAHRHDRERRRARCIGTANEAPETDISPEDMSDSICSFRRAHTATLVAYRETTRARRDDGVCPGAASRFASVAACASGYTLWHSAGMLHMQCHARVSLWYSTCASALKVVIS